MALKPGYSILGLDIGTSCGWALAKDGIIEGSGLVDFSGRGNHPGERLHKFDEWLNDFAGVDEIVVELVLGHGGWGKSIEVFNKLHGVLEKFAYRSGRIPMSGYLPNTLKKRFTGNGRAEKEDMCMRAHQLGWKNGMRGTAMDHDEADACAVVFTRLDELGIQGRFR